MSSQYSRWLKKIEEYERLPLYDPAVLRELKRKLAYANTLDTEAALKADTILRGA